ncbi:unnamed protein product [Peronospora destructor]|uniref:Uncharacterized protein n=1 Tax=Peronospora destructor TaxID=86335 RepID=A0AAV0VCN8_9STRA|nr:unnamed protein product [Peronospora destructor]
MGRRSKLARSVEHLDKDKDRTSCFVAVSGYIRSSKTFVELGATDAVKLTTLVTACGAAIDATGEQIPVPFSIVMTAELKRYDQLRLTIKKLSPGESTRLLPVGTASQPILAADSGSVQLVVQAFRSVPPQNLLPTTGVDMANAKYLIPSTLAPGRETSGNIATGTRLDLAGSTRGSDMRTFMENDTFLSGIGLCTLNEAPSGSLRFVAVDEILRVPRSTFALPVAYLDFLEEQALERSRWIQKRLQIKTVHPRDDERLNVELEFLRKKQEEYLKQRQFLIQQEKRLLDEQKRW